jgi:hypothetical protein
MDMVSLPQYAAKIECNRRRPTQTPGFNMAGLWIQGLYQRGLSCPKSTENHNLELFFVRHHEKMRLGAILLFR